MDSADSIDRSNISALLVCSYNDDYLVKRVSFNYTLNELKMEIFSNWSSLVPAFLKLSYRLHLKINFLEDDYDLQQLISYTWGKQLASVEIVVSMDEASSSCVSVPFSGTAISDCSGIVSASTSSTGLSYGSSSKTVSWDSNFQESGQLFAGGVAEIRAKLMQYYIKTGYLYVFERNNFNRITVCCARKDETGCSWRMAFRQVPNSDGVFKLGKFSGDHSCGVGVIDLKNPRVNSKFIKSLIVNEVRDNPSLKLIDIKTNIKRDYGISIKYDLARKAKEIAIEEIHGDLEASYKQLTC